MYRIGIIGPAPSVKRILEVAHEIEQELTFVPYTYSEVKEAGTIVQKNARHVDFWLFSGYIPYAAALQKTNISTRSTYIFSTEASIYKGMMQLIHDQGKLVTKLSIDMIPAHNIGEGESLQQLKKNVQDVYVKTVHPDIEPNELFQFHYTLWKQNKTEGALTCYPAVYEKLREAGVPSFSMSPTRLEIFQTIRAFFEKIKTVYYKDTQIGIEKISVKDFDTVKEKRERIYEVQQLELKMKENLIHLCEKIDGSLLDEGNGRYTIFSSRGAIERELQALNETAHHLSLEADAAVAVGIGFGQTVLTAETNAHRALQQSKKKTENSIVIIQDDGTIIDSVNQADELAYAYRTNDHELLEKLKKGKINVKTFKKIEALLQKMGWHQFTAKDLAASLQMGERNAQRIVAALCEVGIAEYIGEEAHHQRGRPVKMYRMK